MSKAKKVTIAVSVLLAIVVISSVSLIILAKNRSEIRYTCGGGGGGSEIGGLFIHCNIGNDGSDSIGFITDSEVIKVNSSPFNHDYGWRLVPLKSGRCVFVVDHCDSAPRYIGSEIYDIIVDEDLNVSYSQRTAYKFPFYRYAAIYGEITVQTNDKETVLSGEKAKELRYELETPYGFSGSCSSEPDISDCVKLTFANKNLIKELYISEDKIFYQQTQDETEHWYEFTPDEFFSLDEINELLDLKD